MGSSSLVSFKTFKKAYLKYWSISPGVTDDFYSFSTYSYSDSPSLSFFFFSPFYSSYSTYLSYLCFPPFFFPFLPLLPFLPSSSKSYDSLCFCFMGTYSSSDSSLSYFFLFFLFPPFFFPFLSSSSSEKTAFFF